eukprot:m51a1_g8175 hypothetical protein (299) ;mRNA; f:114172-115610
MSRVPAEVLPKWQEICTKCYADQSKWVLNGFWDQLQGETENIWQWAQSFAKFDESKRAGGCDLDEFWSHKFLESLGQTMTVIEMREKFRQIDADFNKRMSMIEYLSFRFNLKIADVVNAPQGGDPAEIRKAEAMVAAAQASVESMTRALEAATKASEAAWYAEQENKKALEELQNQEKAFQDKKADLERTKNDSSIGVVKRNKAANELDQMLAEDPLPLRKAKINQAATVKKSERARVAADEAKAKSEEAVKDAERKLDEATQFLDKAMRSGGVAKGDVWWLQREITEKKKFLPSKRQ